MHGFCGFLYHSDTDAEFEFRDKNHLSSLFQSCIFVPLTPPSVLSTLLPPYLCLQAAHVPASPAAPTMPVTIASISGSAAIRRPGLRVNWNHGPPVVW